MIFNWFKDDWTSGYTGFDGKTPAITSREDYFARYAKLFADTPEGQKKIADKAASSIAHLDYDWSLNEAK